jgi:hypothetical protein
MHSDPNSLLTCSTELERDWSADAPATAMAMAMVNMMSIVRRFSVVAVMSVALISCSLKLQVDLFDNGGEDVTVKTGDTNLAIKPGRFAQFDYPGNEQNWMLHLSTATCDYIYEVPKTLEHYPWSIGSNGPLKVQVEADFSIYLLPPSAMAITSVAGLGSLQQDGFPLRPTSKNCH